MVPKDSIKENESDFRCCSGSSEWLEIRSFCKSVNKYNNCVMFLLGKRELNNKIHCNLFPSSGWSSQGLKEAKWLVGSSFISLALVTTGDIFIDSFVHSRPVVIFH